MGALKRVALWFLTGIIILSLFIASAYLPPIPFLNHQINNAADRLVTKSRHVYATASSQQQTITPSPSGNEDGSTSKGSVPAGPSWMSVLSAANIIFLNNIKALLLLSIPVFSILFLPAFAYVNGQVVTSISSRYFAVSPTTVIVLLLGMPHTWLEFFAYGIALYESTVLGLKLRKERRLPNKSEIKTLLISVAIAGVVLYLAATTEVMAMLHFR